MLEVFLPTLDTYSDLSLIIPWLIASHYNYAGSMAFPLLIHFAATTVKWYQMEKPENKKWSWVFLLGQFWPQLQALRVIKMMYKRDKRADEERKKLQQEIGFYEPIFEAIPSFLIMTMILVSAGGMMAYNVSDLSRYNYECDSPNRTATYIHEKWEIEQTYSTMAIGLSLDEFHSEYFESNESYLENHYRDSDYTVDHLYYKKAILYRNQLNSFENMCAVFGSISRVPWFFLTYGISIITGTLGVTKVLQIGPCSILKTNGPVMGMFSCKFIMCYFTVLFSILGKVFFVANAMNAVNCIGFEHCDWFWKTKSTNWDRNSQRILMMVAFFFLNILPNLLLAITSLMCTIGCNKKILKVLFGYPIFLVLPIFTPFMMGPKRINMCCPQTVTMLTSNQIGVSKKLTIFNLLLSICMYIVSAVCFCYIMDYPLSSLYLFLDLVPPVLPILILAIVFSCCTILNDYCCCLSLRDTTHNFKTLDANVPVLEDDSPNEGV